VASDLQQTDDWDLINQVRRDPRALGELFRRHSDFVFRLAWSRLRDRHQAEDVAQDVFCRLADSRRRFFRGARFRTWLYRVVASRCVDLQRAAQRADDRQSETLEPGSGASPETHRELDRVMAAVACLPERQREVIVLRLLEGFSTEETARALKISRGSVKTHLHRGRERLKAQFDSTEANDKETLPCSDPLSS